MSLSRVVSGGFREAVSRILDRLCRPSRAGGFEGQSSHQASDLHAAAQGNVSTLLKSLGTSLDGLTSEEAWHRQHKFGFNELVHERRPSWVVHIIKAFKNPVSILLVVVGAVAFLAHSLKTASIFGAIVLMSVLLRFVQEYRSTHAAERLKAKVRNTATVTRSEVRRLGSGPRTREAVRLLARHGKQEIPRRELVPGDIVHLSAGDIVPADVRLVLSSGLFVNQAVLTGVSMPAEKLELLVQKAAANGRRPELESTDPLEVNNLCFMGTYVISGMATAVVVATGRRTYYGAMGRELIGRRAPTNSGRSISDASRLLIRFTLTLVLMALLIIVLTKGDATRAFVFCM